MKASFFFLGICLCVFTACDKKTGPVEPNCPTCWDANMVCVDQRCDCPDDGYLETWVNVYNTTDPAAVRSQQRKLCIKPDKRTFIAYLPPFECIDTFAVTFVGEPFDVTSEMATTPTGRSVLTTLPNNWASLMIATRNVYGPDSVAISLRNINPTSGPFPDRCVELLNNNEVGSLGPIHFHGYFTHKDTISGYLEFEGGSGTKAPWQGHRIEGVKLVRTVAH